MKLSIALALCALSAPALADVVLTKKVHTDEMQGPQGAIPAKDEQQVVWIAKDKLRFESGPVTYIVRLDQQKLHVLRPADRTYSTIPLPVNLANHLSKEDAERFEGMKSRIGVSTAIVTPTEETERIHGWGAKKYKVQVNAVGMVSQDVVWTTKDIEIDWSTYWSAQAAIQGLRPGTEALTEQMKKLEGVTVKAERSRSTPIGKVRIVEELESAERKEAPQGIYDPPSDFTQKPFDPMPELRKLVGAQPNAGPGDAPPPRREKKDGDTPAPGGNGDGSKRRGGGDGKGGG